MIDDKESGGYGLLEEESFSNSFGDERQRD